MRSIVAAAMGIGAVVGAQSTGHADPSPPDAATLSAAVYPVGLAACWPLPAWYPYSWEIVEHTPCPPGYYLIPGVLHPHRYSTATARGHHIIYASRRPYLRPGWWW
jgi:hypothetical protein